jgi:radical SAM/Cys-rich protein
LRAEEPQGEMLLMSLEKTVLPILSQEPGLAPDFGAALATHGCDELVREETTILQINVGKLCNQACHHCHVDAGPKRTEIMQPETVERVLQLLADTPAIRTVDITGGAPELNPNFDWLIREARRLGRHVIDRCNLTALLEPGRETLVEFFAAHEVEVVASLPCYTAENVDKQRGRGVFDQSIRVLHLLNGIGYGLPESNLKLNLVYNPLGTSLPPAQEQLEADYKKQLQHHFGISFHKLFTLTNMPIKRFSDSLNQTGQYAAYMGLLVNHFNPTTLPRVMCRSMISVGWDGMLYDCDFNQMLEIGLGTRENQPRSIWEISSLSGLAGKPIATGSHCFGCTAGAGSSCLGTLV